MTSLTSYDNREDMPLEHIPEYESSIELLADDIPFRRNFAIEAYTELAPLQPESRSPSPLLQLLTTSNTLIDYFQV